MTATRITLTAISLLCLPALGWAQPDRWSPEISAGIGLGHVFRFEDQTFGNPLNAGAAVSIAHRSGVVVEFEVDRVFGLEPRPAPCGLVNQACVGDGRYGPREAAIASFVVHYRFKRNHRVQPFLIAGIGVLWTSSLHTTTYVNVNPAVMVESESRDRGVGPDLGAGLRIKLSSHLAISPEVRWLEGAWLSRENLAVTRLGIWTTYFW
jgi:opacity protein-like surface antigen